MSLKGKFKKAVGSVGAAVQGAAKTAGQKAISVIPGGQMLGNLGGGDGGDMGARSLAAKSLIRKTRQAGAGQISTMSEE